MLISELIVQYGGCAYVNIKKMSMTVGRKKVIVDGVVQDGYELDIIGTKFLDTIEELYGEYYTSCGRDKKSLFVAKKYDELDDKDLCFGEYRPLARARLEYYVLCTKIKGVWKWNERFGKQWFWRSEKYPTLRIKKDWIEN